MLTEQQIRTIVREEIRKGTSTSRFNVSNIPYHVHNGVDSPIISEDNVALTGKLHTNIITSTSETFSIRGVFNVSRITFHGFGYDSSSSPAVSKATISGEVIFGNCNTFSGNGSSIVVSTVPPGLPFVQASTAMYAQTNTSTRTTVNNASRLAYASNPEGVTMASLNLDSYRDNILQFTTVLASNWVLNGILIFE